MRTVTQKKQSQSREKGVLRPAATGEVLRKNHYASSDVSSQFVGHNQPALFAPPGPQLDFTRTPLARPQMQCKLTVSSPDDPFEREADAVAECVMRMPNPRTIQQPWSPAAPPGQLQRKCTKCEEEEKQKLQRQETGAGPAVAPPIVHEVLNSPGQPLDAATREFMEPRFGHDFSRVRVHTDERAAKSARAIDALAYTIGNDIVFNERRCIPTSEAGRRILAHELAHTVQQGHSGATGVQRYEVTDCDPSENPMEVPSTVDDAHKRALSMLNNAIALSANTSDPAVQAAAQTNFGITLPPAGPESQQLWDKVLLAMNTMTSADANAVYECEPKQNWWNGGCIEGNVAISLSNIHLCPLWWSHYSSVECRAQVLLHEWAHKWGKGVNRIFETYNYEAGYLTLPASERIKMPDAYSDYAYALAGGSTP